MQTMTTRELATLLDTCDARIEEQGERMKQTPRDTLAYAAMVESRPGLLAFRRAVIAELDRRGS